MWRARATRSLRLALFARAEIDATVAIAPILARRYDILTLQRNGARMCARW